MDDPPVGGDHGVNNRPHISHYARPPAPALVHHHGLSQTSATTATHISPRGSPSRPPTHGVGQGQLVTLDQVRQGPRPLNEYVENPRPMVQQLQLPHRDQGTLSNSNGHTLSGTNVNGSYDVGHHSPVLRQPQSTGGLKKESSNAAAEEEHTETACKDSIICSQCGRCRCSACTEPRELPKKWLCSNKCECSAQKCIEVCSCLCCVRAIFYHWFKDSDADVEEDSSDDPCACCQRPHCCKRWTCIGVLSLCMPCLYLYWPLRAGLSCVTGAYNRCYRRGCNCRRDRLPGSRRLLIDSESSSA